MPQRTEAVPGKGIIAITYAGRVTIAEATEATVQAIALQHAQGVYRVLVDASAMTAGPSAVEMWHLVQSYPALGAPRQTRVAVIRPRTHDETDLSGFYEVVCQNHCYNSMAFASPTAAEEWLRANGGAPAP